jgi:predicted DNA-binding antitoxin AbrB/MazE fold protein
MTSIMIQAVYRNGVLEPQEKLELLENTAVHVQITPLPQPQKTGGSLFGAFPELASLTGDDFAWARRLWEHGAEEQSRILDALE